MGNICSNKYDILAAVLLVQHFLRDSVTASSMSNFPRWSNTHHMHVGSIQQNQALEMLQTPNWK